MIHPYHSRGRKFKRILGAVLVGIGLASWAYFAEAWRGIVVHGADDVTAVRIPLKLATCRIGCSTSWIEAFVLRCKIFMSDNIGVVFLSSQGLASLVKKNSPPDICFLSAQAFPVFYAEPVLHRIFNLARCAFWQHRR